MVPFLSEELVNAVEQYVIKELTSSSKKSPKEIEALAKLIDTLK